MSQSSTQDYERIEKQRHGQKLEQQAHQANLMEDYQDARAELMDKLMESDLKAGTIEVLRNYTSPDFILSKMSSRDLTQLRWQLETKIIQVFAMHPPRGGVGGKARTYYYDDPQDALEPLRPQDRAKIREFKDGIVARLLRSHDGFQQDKIGESTSRVETINRDEEEDSKGRIRGFLGR